MKALFITLEESSRQNLQSIIDNNFFSSIKDNIHTYGMSKSNLEYKDHTSFKIKSLMGITNIVLNLKYLFKLRKDIFFIIKKNNFTHIFFVDSFDFTKFYLNKFLDPSIKYCQIIGPSVYIWKKNKALFINKYLDHIFSIFIIEQNYYDLDKYSYIGHPLKNKVSKKNHFNANIKNLGFFLGSREQEIKANLPIIKNLISLLQVDDRYSFNLFVTSDYFEFLKKHFYGYKNILFFLNDKNYYKNISNLDFAFACSGTVHLELSFSNIPHFVFYKANLINFFIFDRFIDTKYLSLVNIFNNKEIIKEFVQRNFNAKNLYNHFKLLENNSDELDKYLKNLSYYLSISNFSKLNQNPIIDYLKKSS